MKIIPRPPLPEDNFYDEKLLLDGDGYTLTAPELPVRHTTTVNVHPKALPSRRLADDDDADIAFGEITITHSARGNRFQIMSVCETTRANAIHVAKCLIKALEALPDEGVPMPEHDAPSTI